MPSFPSVRGAKYVQSNVLGFGFFVKYRIFTSRKALIFRGIRTFPIQDEESTVSKNSFMHAIYVINIHLMLANCNYLLSTVGMCRSRISNLPKKFEFEIRY